MFVFIFSYLWVYLDIHFEIVFIRGYLNVTFTMSIQMKWLINFKRKPNFNR